MNEPRMGQNRFEANAGPNEPSAQIVVFAAPASEILVEAVDPFEIAPPNADVVRDQLRLPRMVEERVKSILAMLTIEPAALGVEFPLQELAALGPFFAERRR